MAGICSWRRRFECTRCMCSTLPAVFITLHFRVVTFLVQVKIQALAFSPDEQRLASLGGQDDNSLVGVAAPQLAAW